eukprot:scaffold287219_cov40-Prasinocladus_malaysianus.AAC.1
MHWQQYHEEQMSHKLIPYLEANLEKDKCQTVKRVERSYAQRQKRISLVNKALDKGIENMQAATTSASQPPAQNLSTLTRTTSGTGQGIFIMRLLKDNFDIFQSITITTMQIEVETAVWVVRNFLTEKEWLKNNELGTKTPWD